MWSFIALLLIGMVVMAILLGLSIGVAFLLHWLLPAVGLEMALLISVIAVGQTMLIFGRLINSSPPLSEDIEGESELRPIVILDQEVVLPRRRRRRT